MKATTAQERMDLLDEVNEAARSAMEGWCRHWNAGPDGDGQEIRLRWQDDGTAEVEVDGELSLRLQVEISTSAVAYEDVKPPANKPTGFVLVRAWGEIPTGWFVAAPNGQWYEVAATRHEDGRQHVTLKLTADGRTAEWPRDPAEKVSVRKGTLWNERDYALDSLRAAVGPVTVIRDEGQFS